MADCRLRAEARAIRTPQSSTQSRAVRSSPIPSNYILYYFGGYTFARTTAYVT
ncbi:hypothetical protein KGM_205444 [Danaus plexippus plexippus]|uniref:Uncharacterized protein n=1 Tax=Danaus plexippus plexippus TaxID=278856 RepID=A0A212FNI1_DANPL|nr:hypothetical protein KGM_205444 [Danaus plexippus plexippus]